MHDIKTRDVVKGTIKAIDKSAVTAERMKDAYVRTKGEAEHGVFAAESSPEEYAADRTLTGTETAAHEAVHGLDKAGRKGVKTTKENISKAKDYFQQRRTDLPKKQAQDAMRRVRHSADATQKTIKTVDRSGKTIKQTAKSTGKAAVKTTQETIKTARTTIKTTQAAAKTAQKTAQATAKAAKTAAQTARAATKATAAGIKAAVKATAAAVKARRPPGSIWNVWQGGPSGTRCRDYRCLSDWADSRFLLRHFLLRRGQRHGTDHAAGGAGDQCRLSIADRCHKGKSHL